MNDRQMEREYALDMFGRERNSEERCQMVSYRQTERISLRNQSSLRKEDRSLLTSSFTRIIYKPPQKVKQERIRVLEEQIAYNSTTHSHFARDSNPQRLG